MTYEILHHATYYGGPYRCDVLALKASGSQKGREILERTPWWVQHGGYYKYSGLGTPHLACVWDTRKATRIQYA